MYACCGIPDGNYCYVAHASAQFMEVCAHTKQEMKGGKGEGGGVLGDSRGLGKGLGGSTNPHEDQT